MRGTGWHPEDIKAEIRKRGMTLKDLSISLGMHPTACRKVLEFPLLRAELAIAKLIQVPPQELWPDRYNERGQPIRRGLQRNYRRRLPNGKSKKAPKGTLAVDHVAGSTGEAA
ncbi:MAG: helix-turn-helix domain-containing protein [Geminicoccaceae bacterium]|nr:helix-turn-helix domain-containing protein [Geminicoccaceae bacterium]